MYNITANNTMLIFTDNASVMMLIVCHDTVDKYGFHLTQQLDMQNVHLN